MNTTNSKVPLLESLRSPDPAAPLTPWARLTGLLEAERPTLVVAIIYSVAIGLLTLAVPVAVQSLVNTVAFGAVLQPLFVLTLFVLLALGFSALLNTLRAGVVELLQRSIFARVGFDLTNRLLRVKAEAFDRLHGPELVNRFFDVVTVQKAAALLLIDGLSIFMQTLIGLILVALYHPLLLAFDALLVTAMAFIVFVLGRGAVKTSIKESKAKYAFQAWLEQISAHAIVFKSPGGEALATQRSHELMHEYLYLRQKHFKILIRQVAGSFILQATASSMLLGIGGWLVIERQLTLGQLVASELIVTLMVSGFTKFGKQLEVFYDLQAAIDKLGGLTDLPLERADGEASTQIGSPAGLRFRGVEIGYDKSFLHIEDFEVRPGDRLIIRGEHGAGKSTLADILYGLRIPNAGSIQIDGADFRDVPLRSLRADTALVRGIEIFPGTVLDNVRLGRGDVPIDEISKALSAVALLDEIGAFPEGLNTMLHPSGRPLSRSQAARLMLARAIVSKPRLLILDDALELLEREQERKAIAGMLFDHAAPWTLICISERIDLRAMAGRTAVITDGVMREEEAK